MESWMLVPIAVLLLGAAVIAYGALRDRARRQADQARLAAPPDRIIPGLAPQTASPRYLDPDTARRPVAPDARGLDQDARRALDDRLRRLPPTIDAGWIRTGFTTEDDQTWAVLDDASVVIIDGPLTDPRLAVALLGRSRHGSGGMVIIGDGFADAVAELMEINTRRGTVRVVAVSADAAARATVAAATGAEAVELTDLQAGYLPPEHVGRAARWVSSRDRSWVFDAPGPAAASSASTASTP